MDSRNFKQLFYLICMTILHWTCVQCRRDDVMKNSHLRPTEINQLTSPIMRKEVTVKKTPISLMTRKSRKTNGKEKKMTMKEFQLPHLINIGITSNEANDFIRNNQLRGKPLEVQYERTRETDMNAIEEQLLQEQVYLEIIKRPSVKNTKDKKLKKYQPKILPKKKIYTKNVKKRTRKLGFI